MLPGSSPIASYVQRWALCSNYPANMEASGSGSEELKKFSLPSPAVLRFVKNSWKKTQIKKNIEENPGPKATSCDCFSICIWNLNKTL